MTTLTIERLGRQGDGVARGPDGPVHVARALPGEVVDGAVVDGRMDAPRIVAPSPDRVAPPCPHFRRCGGCAVQHASDATVAAWKRGVVAEALAREGLAVEVTGPDTSPPQSRRRAALSGRKTKKGAIVGFHVRGSDEVVAIPSCRVLDPAILAALPALEASARLAAPRGAEVGLHVTATATGLDLAVTGGRALDRETLAALVPLASSFARITWEGEPALQQVAPEVPLGPAMVVLPPGAFLQATPQGETALVAAVTVALAGAGRVVDLFAGCGTFALPLARHASVHAVEADRAALDALAAGARRATGLRAITTESRDLFRDPLDATALARFDAAVIDPPRAGARAQVGWLARSALGRIAYVSCNPASFAADAAILVSAGWRMGPVRVVDQFRWSPHIETATAFERP